MQEARGRILIVDDEPALLKMMSVYLSRLGFVVCTAATTEAAWDKADRNASRYSVAVLDATMPGRSLAELALKLLSENPAMRVIAASGYPVELSEIRAAAPGRVEFLQKPFAPEMLANMVRRMLGEQEEI